MRVSPTSANFEVVLTQEDETFLWRRDDYPWERNVWNFHPEVEIHLITNASGFAMVGDFIGEFRPGELHVVGSNLPHDWVTPLRPDVTIEGRDIVIQFHPDKIRQATGFLPELATIGDYLERARRGLRIVGATRDQAERLILAMEHQSGAERLATFLSLLALLQKSDEYDYLSSHTFSPDLPHGTLSSLQQALSYIHANLSDDLFLSDIAAMVGMSESACSRFFKKNCGHSFTDHVNKLRVSKTAHLLAETNRPITDICFEVGFRNLSNFNRVFLRHYNLTPSKYRKLAGSRRRLPPLPEILIHKAGSSAQPRV
jgi:AraC-like DNA-binding protein